MSRLSVHITQPGDSRGYADFLSLPSQNGCPVKIIYQLNANTVSDVLRFSPSTRLVYRRQDSTWERLPNVWFQGDPRKNCEDWMLNRKSNGKNLMDYWRMNNADYYDPINEPAPGTPEQAKWLNAWMVRALEIAHENGFKLAMFSFPAGCPDYPLWQYFCGNDETSSMFLGKKYGAILSLHEYGIEKNLIDRNPDGSLSENTIHLTLRHRKVWELLPENCRIPIIISEAGCGNGYAVPLTGSAYVKDAIEYDKEIMKDYYVLSACLFQLGGGESNLQPVLAELTEYIKSTPTPPVIEPPPVIPPTVGLPYAVIVYLGPQNATLDQMKLIQGEAFATKSTVCQSADDARHLVKAGAAGSKVIIYDPASWPGGLDGILKFFEGCEAEIRYLSQPQFRLASPIRDIPYCVTDKFNAPRNYANGKHEGLDLDCYDDVNGKSVNVYAALDGVVEKVVTTWLGTGYGKHVVIKHDWYGQVYKTWYCHLAFTSVSAGQKVTSNDIIGQGGNTGTTAIHLHFMVQMIPGGLNGYFTPLVIDPEPLILEPSGNALPPKRGVGMGNLNLLTPAETGAIKLAKCTGFLANTLPDYSMARSLIKSVRAINPEIMCVGRLFFSADSENKTKFSPEVFVATVKNGLDGFYAEGVRYFQIHNEPNLELEGNGWNWSGGTEFSNWLINVIKLLKVQYPEAKWGYPGLSPQPNTEQFWTDSRLAMDICDWVGVHAYWQFRGTTGWGMESLDGGYHYKRLCTSKPLMITEFSNNSPQVALATKGEEYADYYKLVNIPAFSFCLSWSQDSNHEGWVQNNIITDIPKVIGQHGY